MVLPAARSVAGVAAAVVAGAAAVGVAGTRGDRLEQRVSSACMQGIDESCKIKYNQVLYVIYVRSVVIN